MAARAREPVRHCVVCRQARPKRELLRVVRGPDGKVSLDAGGKAPGRGAYVCPERQCVTGAGKRFVAMLKVRGDLSHVLTDWTE